MRSTITSRGQTVIPAEVRRFFHLSAADRLEWVIENNTIRVIQPMAYGFLDEQFLAMKLITHFLPALPDLQKSPYVPALIAQFPL